MNIYDLISRAQKLRQETKLDSVSPDRVGALCEDTLKYINEFQLLASSPSLHKIYASVSAMQADKSPKSDLTGKALKPGQLVVIVPANQSDATAGDVYRYDGPSGNTSAWTFVSKIGAVPADAELNATSANPVQNKVVTEKLTELESEKANKVLGKNLMNPNDITRGQGYWSYNDNTPIIAPQYSITGFIPVNGNVIINKTAPGGTGHRVFDANKNIIRLFTTQQYTYQEGDAYVRFTIGTSSIDSTMVERGNVSTSFEMYTDKYDVVTLVEQTSEDIEQTNIKVGLTPKAEVAATSDASYNEVEYAIQKGHRYVITNTSEVEVADVRTIDSKGNTIDILEVLYGGQSWNLIATDGASKVKVYFAHVGQNVTICEKPLVGDTIVERVETLEKDVTDLSKHLSADIPYIIYKDEDIISLTQAEQNGCVMRRRGYDIPKGYSGNDSMVQFSVRKLHQDVLTEFIINTNIPASKFDGTWGKVTQMGSGLIKVSVTPALNNRHSTNCFLVFYSLGTDRDWYLRLSQVHFYPQSAEAIEVFAKTYSKDNDTLIYDVFKDFDETTEGYGETRFSNIVDAHKATSRQGFVEKYGAVIRVMPGIYNFAEYFPITEGESGYIGIITNTGEVFESFDIDMPETTRIEWDGHYGLADSAKLTSQQSMARCPFHVNTLFRSGGRTTIIRGFHFVCANIRYCIHPESAGYGNGQSWVISNCILDWNGSDKVDGFAGRNLGIGISCGEDGLVDRVKFGGTHNRGMGGHNNGYSLSQTNGVKPSFIAGANLKIKRCDLGNAPIYMTTFAHDNMTPDSLIVEGCSNVSKLSVGFEGSTSGKQEWLCSAINSDIADNQTL